VEPARRHMQTNAQGVHRPEGMDLSAGAGRPHRDRHDRVHGAARARFNPVSISGYHIREAGSTAVQELAFTLADGWLREAALARGLDVDSSPRGSPSSSTSTTTSSRRSPSCGPPAACGPLHEGAVSRKEAGVDAAAHAHPDGGGVCTAQQPLNNVARVALQALAAVLGGASRYTRTPTTRRGRCHGGRGHRGPPHAADHRRGNRRRPHRRSAGGSYYLERLTDQMEAAALEYIQRIDAMGGMVQAIDEGIRRRRSRTPPTLPASWTTAARRSRWCEQVRHDRREADPLPAHRRAGGAGADRAGGPLQGVAGQPRSSAASSSSPRPAATAPTSCRCWWTP